MVRGRQSIKKEFGIYEVNIKELLKEEDKKVVQHL